MLMMNTKVERQSDAIRQRRLADIKKGKSNLKSLEELARSHWADHSTRMPEPIPHRRVRLKTIKVELPGEFCETHRDRWDPMVDSQPIVEPPGGAGPISDRPFLTGRSWAGPHSVRAAALSLPSDLLDEERRATLNLDPMFYEFTPRELARPFVHTGPLLATAPQYRGARPAEHSSRLSDVSRRTSLINRDINIRKKRPQLTQTNMVSSSFGTVEVMRRKLPVLVGGELENPVLPEVIELDPTTLHKENTTILLSRIDKMLNVNKQKPKVVEAVSENSVSAETPNFMDLRSDFSDDEDLPEVVTRLLGIVECDAAGDMLKIQGEVTGSYRPIQVNVKEKCMEWLGKCPEQNCI